MAFSFAILKAQPINDTTCLATEIIVTDSCEFQSATTVGATNSAGIGVTTCGFSGKDIWFKITVPASGMFTVETSEGSILDGLLAVYTGTCDDLTFAYCDDDGGPGFMPLLDMQGFVPGSTVFIRFFKKFGGTGTFNICVWDDNPALQANNDCYTAQQLCTTAEFSSNSLGNGEVDDLTGLNKGCLTPTEHQSSWYYFTFDSPGEFEFTITPINPADNYNFALWGPDLVCPLEEEPIRCSYSSSGGETGMGSTYVDLTEGVLGDNWVKHMTPNPGETYILLIDNYSESGEGFTFNFGGPPNIGCETYLLPIELTAFVGNTSGADNVLEWATASEINNDYFILEHSINAENFLEIGKIEGAGNSESPMNYLFTDDNPYIGTTYYRLKQVDYDGNFKYSEIINVENITTNYFIITPNPANGLINVDFEMYQSNPYTMEIINSLGIITNVKQGNAIAGMNNQQIELTGQGVYWIILRSEGHVDIKHVVNY